MRRHTRPEHLQVPKLLAGFQALLPQLDDVHAVAEDRVQEARQVALALPGVGAQVQARGSQAVTQVIRCRHAQKASACARLFTSVRRCSASACTGVPGSDSSAVNSQLSASVSVNPQSKSRVSVPPRP